jgi:hypothetical protein
MQEPDYQQAAQDALRDKHQAVKLGEASSLRGTTPRPHQHTDADADADSDALADVAHTLGHWQSVQWRVLKTTVAPELQSRYVTLQLGLNTVRTLTQPKAAVTVSTTFEKLMPYSVTTIVNTCTTSQWAMTTTRT